MSGRLWRGAVAACLTVALVVVVDGRAAEGRENEAVRDPAPSDTSFRTRTFDLPSSVPWDHLFPAARGYTSASIHGYVDSHGIPMRFKAGHWVYLPTRLAIAALRRLAVYQRTGKNSYLVVVERLAAKLQRLAITSRRALWLPFEYDVPHQGLRAPWFNALGQATALALFSRLHRITGDASYLATATGLFHSFERLERTGRPWVAQADHGYLWAEHWPGGLRGHVLNAHAYAVIGLRDYWQETSDAARPGGTAGAGAVALAREARGTLEAALTTLLDKGAAFRRPGTYSWYCLKNRVAHAGYHAFHIRQLRAIAYLSGEPYFDHLADLFEADYP
jgi:hypothetical protein